MKFRRSRSLDGETIRSATLGRDGARLSAQETANGAGLTAELLDAIEADQIPTDDEVARIKELLAALGG
ncbi:hypothetical protein [Candidatus Mycobacterium methanotrophicum]|uniref:Uncharacterized protein n=1 Tax=Candidatus Mycobacterium methanotrophicum TaxID=2943498 RepID=A0ABY4QJ50_9MYCO|nr:hypothetical protein [Candidatus Mycobacterium methanotrophicum]UQX09828.1 hypothetical protein M5I08_16310 [Candidatus Mycobacterium methanotrophicum]